MMQKLFLLLMLYFNVVLLVLFHPLSFILVMFMKVLVLSVYLSTFYFTSWISYVLFLIFLGGLMIIFMYIIALMNEMKQKSMVTMKKIALLVMVNLMLSLLLFFSSMKVFSKVLEMSSNFCMMDPSLSMLKLFNYPENTYLYILVILLFFMLFVVVKITLTLFGPFRICS